MWFEPSIAHRGIPRQQRGICSFWVGRRYSRATSIGRRTRSRRQNSCPVSSTGHERLDRAMHRLHYFHALVSVPRWNSDLSRRLALGQLRRRNQRQVEGARGV
jgi:hypothetical protein